MKTVIVLGLLLSLPLCLFSQWESMHGPFGSFINDLGKNDHYVFAATTAGLYRSTDVGLTWEIMPFFEHSRYPCIQFDVMDSLLVADAVEIRPDTNIRHMYKSIDDGETWIEIGRPPVFGWVDVGISGSAIFAYDHTNVWMSKDDGITWFQSLVNHLAHHPGCFNHYGPTVFVGDSAYLYIYKGDDANWVKSKIPIAESIGTVYAADSVLLVRDYVKHRLFVSDDFGKNWDIAPGQQWGEFENYFAQIGDTLYATDYETMYTSVDKGHTWESRFSKGMDWAFNMIAVDSVLLSGYEYAGLFRSTDFGREFNFSSDGIDASYVQSLYVLGDQLLTGGYLQGVFNYDASLNQWQKKYYDEDARVTCYDITVNHEDLFLSASGEIYEFDTLTDQWNQNNPEEFGLYSNFFQTPYGLMTGGNNAGWSSRLQLLNPPMSWEPFTPIIEGNETSASYFAQTISYQFLASGGKIIRAQNNGVDWAYLPDFLDPDRTIKDLICIDKNVFVIASDYPDFQNRLYVSHDNGTSWSYADEGIPIGNNTGILGIISAGDYLVCHTDIAYFARKDELTWHSFNEGLPYRGISDLAFDGHNLYAAIFGQGVWKRSADDLFLTSNEEPTEANDFHIYPNPAYDKVTISCKDLYNNHALLQLYNLNGRLVLEKSDSDLLREINISYLPAGLYSVRLKTSSGYYTSKLIKGN